MNLAATGEKSDEDLEICDIPGMVMCYGPIPVLNCLLNKPRSVLPTNFQSR